jgi:hypothetical protein
MQRVTLHSHITFSPFSQLNPVAFHPQEAQQLIQQNILSVQSGLT